MFICSWTIIINRQLNIGQRYVKYRHLDPDPNSEPEVVGYGPKTLVFPGFGNAA